MIAAALVFDQSSKAADESFIERWNWTIVSIWRRPNRAAPLWILHRCLRARREPAVRGIGHPDQGFEDGQAIGRAVGFASPPHFGRDIEPIFIEELRIITHLRSASFASAAARSPYRQQMSSGHPSSERRTSMFRKLTLALTAAAAVGALAPSTGFRQLVKQASAS
jgi:hypothetical protein